MGTRRNGAEAVDLAIKKENMDTKYETIETELAAIFADCDTEHEILEERHRIYDIFHAAAQARLREVFAAEPTVIYGQTGFGKSTGGGR
jgi:putative ribosome biogenesis GTPase RsgA